MKSSIRQPILIKIHAHIVVTITLICLFFLTDTPRLFSDIFQYVKKAEMKEEGQQIKNVDFIYVISLDGRPEKYEMTREQLQKYGITPYRFSAVNGWELSLDQINDIGIKYDPNTMKQNLMGTTYDPEACRGLDTLYHHEMMSVPGRPYFCHCLSRGCIGILASHISVLWDAWNSNYNTVWIMEDDIQVIQDPRLITKMIRKLDRTVGKDGWNILFTDRDTKDQKGNYVPCLSYAPRPNWNPIDPLRFQKREEVASHFIKVGARYGAHSYIIRRSGIKKILEFFKKYGVFLPYDMEFYLPEGMNLYSLSQDIVSTIPQALSDNGHPGYKDKERK